MSLTMMMSYLRDERGAEMAEWVVVVAILSVVASGLFGPGGVLDTALKGGINTISTTVTSAS
jgi:Flp pilus assembly pilin Flp